MEQAGTGRPWKPGLLLFLILGIYYGALQNGQWVPISDADLYIAIARDLVHGQGFTFNGMAVKAVPPGWPLALAGAMRVSGSFWFLGIVQMCLMLGAFVLFYRILLRLTSVRRAFIACLTVGILSPVYHRAFLLHTEALFCLLGAAIVLLALQLREGRSASWRIPLMLVLAAAAVTVRWAGVMLTPVIAGALLSGQVRPALNKLSVCVVLVAVVTCGTFLALRYSRVTSPAPAAAVAVGQGQTLTYTAQEHPIAAKLRGAVFRLPQAGVWFSELLAEVVHVERTFRPIHAAANAMGWVLFGLMVAGMVPFVRQRQWLPPGALIYSLALIGLWQNAVARYLVPVAPLLFLALLNGVDSIARIGASPRWRRLSRVVMVTLFAGIAVCNFSLYSVDVWKLHGRDFYGGYFAGQAKPLIAIAESLEEPQRQGR